MIKKIKYKDWSQEKKDKHRIAVNKWIGKNKEKHLAHIKEYNKKYRKKNLEMLRMKSRKNYRKIHPNMIKIGWDVKNLYKQEQYSHCITCGENKRPYHGKGLCDLCYEKTRKKYKANWFQEQQKKKKRLKNKK